MLGVCSLKCFLLMQRNRVIYSVWNVMVLKIGENLSSGFFIFYCEGILMKYMVCISFFDRRLDTLELIQDVVVFLSRIIPSLIILIQVFKFDVEDSCLQTIQSGIETDDIVVVPDLHAMIGDDAYRSEERRVV